MKRIQISLPDEVYNTLIQYSEAQSTDETKVLPSRVVCEALIQYLDIQGVDISPFYFWGGNRPGAGRPKK